MILTDEFRNMLACGHVEYKSTDWDRYRKADLFTELYHEGCAFHVRQLDRRPGAAYFRTFWECFDTLEEAWALFAAQPGTDKHTFYDARDAADEVEPDFVVVARSTT